MHTAASQPPQSDPLPPSPSPLISPPLPSPPRSAADTFIQKTRKLYLDTRTQRNLSKLSEDIAEVHSIMTRNIQEVLGQGERLDSEQPFAPHPLSFPTLLQLQPPPPPPLPVCNVPVGTKAPPKPPFHIL